MPSEVRRAKHIKNEMVEHADIGDDEDMENDAEGSFDNDTSETSFTNVVVDAGELEEKQKELANSNDGRCNSGAELVQETDEDK